MSSRAAAYLGTRTASGCEVRRVDKDGGGRSRTRGWTCPPSRRQVVDLLSGMPVWAVGGRASTRTLRTFPLKAAGEGWQHSGLPAHPGR